MNTKAFQVLTPATILYGEGALNLLGPKMKGLGKKALIVTDKIMTEIGNVNKLYNILDVDNIGYELFNEVNAEPTDIIVEKGLSVFKDNNCDFIIAIGGGSPIDAAKAIGALAANGGSIVDYMGIDNMTKPSVPIVAIATTSGTGSEVTKFTIIADTKNDVKMLIGSQHIMPAIAVNDPLLTLSVPAKTTAATGVDALTHAVEAFISRKSQPYTDMVALSAISKIAKYLRRAWSNGDDIEARSAMMQASMEAGIAFNNSSVTIVHGMSRPIGANFHIPHGISNAVLLPACMEFAMMSAPEKFGQIAEAFGERIDGLTVMEAAQKGVKAIVDLCNDLEIPTITGLGIDHEKFMELAPKMAKDAINSGSPANTPRKNTEEDIIGIYRKAL